MSTGETVHFVLMIFLTPISFGVMAAVLVWFFTQKTDSEQASRVERIWSRRAEWSEAVCRQLIDRQISAGMLPEMVQLAWGAPTSIEGAAGAAETWVYQSRRTRSRVSFKDGRVSAVDGGVPESDRKNTVWLYIALLLALAFVVSVITVVIIFWVS